MKDPDRPESPGPTGGYQDPRDRADSSNVGQYAGLGLQFAASILLFLYVGQWLDRRFGTAPVFLLLGVFLGAGGSFYSMYRKLMAAQEREERDRAERKARESQGRDAPPRGTQPRDPHERDAGGEP